MDRHHCAECGAAASRFEGETFSIARGQDKTLVDNLSGWRCECGDVDFDPESTSRYANASDNLVLAERKRQADSLRSIRKRLGLTQQVAARLAGGGHNAFSRYERAEVAPLAAVVNLFKLLDSHPDLLSELDTTVNVEAKGQRKRKTASFHAVRV